MSKSTARRATLSFRKDAARFAEADVDESLELTHDEFVALHKKALRDAYSEDAIRSWAAAMDLDGGGTVALNEWFHWSLAKETLRTGKQAQDCIQAIFKLYDKDGSGFLDPVEFQRGMEHVGFGVLATTFFTELDDDKSGCVQYSELVKKVPDLLSIDDPKLSPRAAIRRGSVARAAGGGPRMGRRSSTKGVDGSGGGGTGGADGVVDGGGGVNGGGVSPWGSGSPACGSPTTVGAADVSSPNSEAAGASSPNQSDAGSSPPRPDGARKHWSKGGKKAANAARAVARAKEMARLRALHQMSSAWIEFDKRSKMKESKGEPLFDTFGWCLDASDGDLLGEQLRAGLARADASVVEVLGTFNRSKAGESVDGCDVDVKEFVSTMRKRLAYAGSSDALKEVFRRLDLDESGTIGLPELFSFVLGRANHVSTRKSGEVANPRGRVLDLLRAAWIERREELLYPHEKKVLADEDDSDEEEGERRKDWALERLRAVTSVLLQHAGLSSVDLMNACDRDRSHEVSRKEWLHVFKRIFTGLKHEHDRDELDLWDLCQRRSVKGVFDRCAGKDNVVQSKDLDSWLAKGFTDDLAELERLRIRAGTKASRTACALVSPRYLPSLARPHWAQAMRPYVPNPDAGPMSQACLRQSKIAGEKTLTPKSLDVATLEFERERRFWVRQIAANRARLGALQAVRRQREIEEASAASSPHPPGSGRPVRGRPRRLAPVKGARTEEGPTLQGIRDHTPHEWVSRARLESVPKVSIGDDDMHMVEDDE
jgi:Ca2+-binding EF-hand superfamily protein